MPPWERYSGQSQGPWSRYAQPAEEGPSVVADIVKSAGAGLAEGAISMASAGDARELASKGVDYLGNKLGASPETVEKVKTAGAALARSNPLTAMFAIGPTSDQLQKKVEEHTGEFHKPQTLAGEYARTVGQFVPAAAAPGPGGIIRRVVTQAALPGVASEAAGQYTKDTAAEPYARVAAALTAAVAGSKRVAPERVTASDLKASAKSAYESPEVKGLVLDPSAVSRVGQTAERAMEAGGARRSFAGPAFNVNDELQNLPNTQVARSMQRAGLSPGATIDDIKNVRTAQGEVVRGGTDPLTGQLNPQANAAVTSRKKISEYLANIPASDVIAGDAQAAGKLLRQADADYAASKRTGVVEALMRRAELQAGSANSGQNVNNAMRQKLRGLLANERKTGGFSPEEIQQLERAVLGTRTGNAARFLGNALGPSGALMLVPGVGLGAAATGLGADPQVASAIGGLSLLAGRGARAVANRSTARQVAKFQDMAALRAPSHDAIASTKAAQADLLTSEARRAAIARALLNASVAPRLNVPQH